MLPADARVERLRRVRALDHLTTAVLAGLAPMLSEVRIESGSVLTREGVVAKEAYVVVDGTADVFVDGERVATIGAGDFVGDVASPADLWPCAVTVRASAPMVLLVVGRQALAALRATHVDHRRPS
jgi:CRP-like cAMP-binding protein